MRKYIILLSMTAITSLSWGQAISKAQLRQNFIQAIERRSALDSFVRLIESSGCMSPSVECYLGISNALQIQYINGMWSKYKMLDRSRSHINTAVEKSPQDAELHFIRFMLEHNIPKFLGMSTHMQEDLRFIFNCRDFLNDDIGLQKIAMEFIASSGRCSPEQKKMLEKNMDELRKKEYAQR